MRSRPGRRTRSAPRRTRASSVRKGAVLAFVSGSVERVLCAWANPLMEDARGNRAALPAEMFAAHELSLADAGATLHWQVLEPCRAFGCAQQ